MQHIVKKIEDFLPGALYSDRLVITREIIRIKRSGIESLKHKKVKKRLFYLEKLLETSVRKRKWRINNLPEPSFNKDLPITIKKDEIIDSIKNNRVVIISGETGSGKTTQIPKFCLAAKRGTDGMIGCTQPRRIAAITVANRIAEEMGEKLGASVGYKIRFADKTGKKSFIKIMTDGIILAETGNDPLLSAYDTIIIDEAHERSLNIDFVLGYLKILFNRRKNLKLIITSATIDTEKFSRAFFDAPIIEVSGRMYPVELRYFSKESENKNQEEQTHVEMAAAYVEILLKKTGFGDILIFMPTERDIRETGDLIEGRRFKGVTVFPLFARLSALEQANVFSRIRGRKIIIATNIAETSITIPGIKYVIDTGLARISKYLPSSRITSLPVEPVSRSSADQRKGRCGRVENGVCIRLYSEDDYNLRPLYTLPEILRTNLAEVIMRMIALNLGDIKNFPFIDEPPPKSIRDGYDLLMELGAIIHKPVVKKNDKTRSESEKHKTISNAADARKRYFLTEKGRLMSKMPVDPRLSRILIEARNSGCLKEIAVITSALSIQDPKERPSEKGDDADARHKEFNDSSSDFITLLNIWNRYHDRLRAVKSRNRMKKICREWFISFKRMREWCDIYEQIETIIKEFDRKDGSKSMHSGGRLKIPENEADPIYAKIHKSLLSGFLSNIAVKKEKNIYSAAKEREVMLFPGSGIFNKGGGWIVASEMVETSRLFARRIANIDPGWLEEAGRDQCKHTYMQPHWERSREEVVAFEQLSLYGLIIVSRRPVSYGRINPFEASEIFIRNALVQGDMKTIFPFMKHNRALINGVSDIENRIRKRDILIEEEDLYNFYDKKLNGVYDVQTLKKFIKEKKTDRFLHMEKKDLFKYFPDEQELAQFPDKINLGNKNFKCVYKFNPGKADDGITIKIPSSMAGSVNAEKIDWLVSGLYREKITALIKGLPKEYRKRFVPISDTVDIVVNEMPIKSGHLLSELGKFIYRRFGIDIPSQAWPDDLLPDYLKARISITGPGGREIRSGRDKSVLLEKVSEKKGTGKSDGFTSEIKKWERYGLTGWDFTEIPDKITLNGKNGAKSVFYPGLEENLKNNKKSVNLRLFKDSETALKFHKKGVALLFSIYFAKDLKFLKKKIRLPEKMRKSADYFGGAASVEKKIFKSITDNFFLKNIRAEKAFLSHSESISPLIFPAALELLDKTIAVIKAYHDVRAGIFQIETMQKFDNYKTDFLKSLRDELSRLVPDTFMSLYDTNRLTSLVRYIKAIGVRVQRAAEDFNKDMAKAERVKTYTDKLNRLLSELSIATSEEKRKSIEDYFWMIEEYKVSVFAQELKTALPVSKKRLNTKLQQIERMV